MPCERGAQFSSWPTITLGAALTSRRPAFLRWLTTLRSMFARITCSIGNDRFTGSWCMLYSPEAQRLDSNCPSPTTTPRRRLHREYQTFLHHLLLETFQNLCPAVTASLSGIPQATRGSNKTSTTAPSILTSNMTSSSILCTTSTTSSGSSPLTLLPCCSKCLRNNSASRSATTAIMVPTMQSTNYPRLIFYNFNKLC